ncbi:hypothetical protein [Microbacterium excoecariae]|uniref:hypothetical protein n=1 Tax=Microbacterium excoecariae TaxID=2715210 RepID=UPI001407FA8E|nr:hypothetical protein [Microbacterium excoecariae]
MLGFTQLARRRDAAFVGAVRRIADRHDHVGVFNPSLGRVGETTLLAYRAIPRGERAIRAYLATWTTDPIAHELTDLTLFGEELGLPRVADPKIVTGADAAYVTFNTGFSKKVNNDIFLLPVYPHVGRPQRLVADFDRQRVEKNWAFVLAEDREPFAIYQLAPYRELRISRGRLGDGADLTVSLREPASTVTNAEGLTIGTQPVAVDGALRLMAHEKWVVRGKRAYFGRAVRIDGAGTDDVRVAASRPRVVHRWREALPHEPVHNPNLLSATYFSGLLRDGDDLLLGYGINDTDFSIARTPLGTADRA